MLRIILCTLLLALPLAGVSHADEENITPYGDYCRECTSYGTCKDVMPPKAAVHALTKYYQEKGYSVGNIHHKGRFIEADIFKDDRQVDKVLFDRKTGRLRSVY
ncbi:MAG: hypothetical protein AB1632_03195 [Nitrospirota bacterium]